jgi:hypothetical protein
MARLSGAPPGSRYQDQRHYVVADSLAELRGPTSGVVILDPALDWSPDRHYDLDQPGDLLIMYQVVLNEASNVDELRRWLNGEILRRLWTVLWLPTQVRAAWEARLPELSGGITAKAS